MQPTQMAPESRGTRPAWMMDVPTPFTRVTGFAATESQTVGTTAMTPNAEATRLAEIVSQAAQLSLTPHDTVRLLPVITELRRLLSVQLHPPSQQVIDLGGLPPIISLLNAPSSSVQLEAAWVLTNVAADSSEHALAVVDAGGPEALCAALQTPGVKERADLCAQLLWVLGNIAGDKDVRLRDRLLEAEVVGHLGQLFGQIPELTWDLIGRKEVLRKLTWVMSCLCAGKPAPKLDDVECAFDYFEQVVTGTDDEEMLSEALQGLVYLLEGATENEGDTRVARMLSAGFGDEGLPAAHCAHPLVARLVQSLGRNGQRTSETVGPAMKILGGLVGTSNPAYTDMVINAGALKTLKCILAESNCPPQIRKEAAWVISNVTAGNAKHALKFLDESGAFDALKTALERAPNDVRRECAWALANLAKQGTNVLQGMDCRELFRLISVALKAAVNPTLQLALLDAAEIMFCHSAKQASLKGLLENPLLPKAENFGFLETLEGLQHTGSETVCQKVVYMLEKYFAADGENQPPKEAMPTTPSAGQRPALFRKSAGTPSAICEGSPARPGYKFGA